jgi:hypothetical protein
VTRKLKMWDHRHTHICPVCKKKIEFKDYYTLPLRTESIFLHKGECTKKARKNPNLLLLNE